MYLIPKLFPVDLVAAGALLAAQPQQQMDQLNWPSLFPYAPKVQFAMCHDGSNVYIRFEVDEKSSRAMQDRDAHDVYKDSCVEVFLMPADDGLYYNFEFNCIGTLDYSCRPGRHDAEKASVECHAKVERLSSLPVETFEEKELGTPWSLVAKIPVGAFFRHDIGDFSGCSMKMNAFKCGDELSTRHYVTWQPISTEKPDYHRPEFFAEVKFE